MGTPFINSSLVKDGLSVGSMYLFIYFYLGFVVSVFCLFCFSFVSVRLLCEAPYV